MPVRCSHCQFRYERGPGYFLGSSYINYGISALSITVLFMVGKFHLRWETNTLMIPCTALCLLPLVNFRYARAFWLALDCYFDSSVLTDEDRAE